MDRGRAAGALLALAACIACSAAAPTASNQTALDLYEGAPEGCYYNFQHYGEGDRIMTNEPCLNCTCHNRMLMCYLKVCPFTKAIGQDCTVEKRADQCCPIVTCPDVPVDLLTSTSTTSPAEYGATGLGKLDKYGCSINGKYFPEGSKVPPTPNKPCEHCYCIRNMTTCVMQECTLHVDGCTPIYHRDVCCPVRYSCDHLEDEVPLLDDMSTTVRPTPGFLLTTTTISPVTQMSQDCIHDDKIFSDGALIKTEKACEHCYCMKGDIVCVVQECGAPMENEGKNCTSMPPGAGQCCPDTYLCEGDEMSTDITTESIIEKITTLSPPRRNGDEGSGYRNEPEVPYTEMPTMESELEGSGEEQDTTKPLGPEETIPSLEDGDQYISVTTKAPISYEEHEQITEETPFEPHVSLSTTDATVKEDVAMLTTSGIVEAEKLGTHEHVPTTESYGIVTTESGDSLNTVPDVIPEKETTMPHKYSTSATPIEREEVKESSSSEKGQDITIGPITEYSTPKEIYTESTVHGEVQNVTPEEITETVNSYTNSDITGTTSQPAIKEGENLAHEGGGEEKETFKPELFVPSTTVYSMEGAETFTTEPDHAQNTVIVAEEESTHPHLYTTSTTVEVPSVEEEKTTETNIEENIVTDKIIRDDAEGAHEHIPTAVPTLLGSEFTTAEPDKGLNTIPSEILGEDSHETLLPERTTLSVEIKPTESSVITDAMKPHDIDIKPTIISDIMTPQSERSTKADQFTITTEPSYRKEDEGIVSTEKQKGFETTTVKSEFVDEGLIPTSEHDEKYGASSDVPSTGEEFITSAPEYTKDMAETIGKETTTESITDTSLIYESLPSKTSEPASEQESEPSSSTEKPTDVAFRPEDIETHEEPSRIPGEGDCLLNGETYRNNSVVPSTNNCHTGCRCASSIIKCDPIICSPPPDYMDNCQSIYDSPDSCCPTYVCDHPRETVPPQSDNQMSGTESPMPLPTIECRGDQCELSEPSKQPTGQSEPCTSGSCSDESDHKPGIECGSEGCLDIAPKPETHVMEQTDECTNGKCKTESCANGDCQLPQTQVSPIKPCEGENCEETGGVLSSPSPQLCENEDDCKSQEIPAIEAAHCEGESCKKIDCDDSNCDSNIISPPQDTQQVPCKEEGGCKPLEVTAHDCTGDEPCRRKEISTPDEKLPSTCEGPNCKHQTETTVAPGSLNLSTHLPIPGETPSEEVTENVAPEEAKLTELPESDISKPEDIETVPTKDIQETDSHTTEGLTDEIISEDDIQKQKPNFIVEEDIKKPTAFDKESTQKPTVIDNEPIVDDQSTGQPDGFEKDDTSKPHEEISTKVPHLYVTESEKESQSQETPTQSTESTMTELGQVTQIYGFQTTPEDHNLQTYSTEAIAVVPETVPSETPEVKITVSEVSDINEPTNLDHSLSPEFVTEPLSEQDLTTKMPMSPTISEKTATLVPEIEKETISVSAVTEQGDLFTNLKEDTTNVEEQGNTVAQGIPIDEIALSTKAPELYESTESVERATKETDAESITEQEEVFTDISKLESLTTEVPLVGPVIIEPQEGTEPEIPIAPVTSKTKEESTTKVYQEEKIDSVPESHLHEVTGVQTITPSYDGISTLTEHATTENVQENAVTEIEKTESPALHGTEPELIATQIPVDVSNEVIKTEHPDVHSPEKEELSTGTPKYSVTEPVRLITDIEDLSVTEEEYTATGYPEKSTDVPFATEKLDGIVPSETPETKVTDIFESDAKEPTSLDHSRTPEIVTESLTELDLTTKMPSISEEISTSAPEIEKETITKQGDLSTSPKPDTSNVEEEQGNTVAQGMLIDEVASSTKATELYEPTESIEKATKGTDTESITEQEEVFTDISKLESITTEAPVAGPVIIEPQEGIDTEIHEKPVASKTEIESTTKVIEEGEIESVPESHMPESTPGYDSTSITDQSTEIVPEIAVTDKQKTDLPELHGLESTATQIPDDISNEVIKTEHPEVYSPEKDKLSTETAEYSVTEPVRRFTEIEDPYVTGQEYTATGYPEKSTDVPFATEKLDGIVPSETPETKVTDILESDAKEPTSLDHSRTPEIVTESLTELDLTSKMPLSPTISEETVTTAPEVEKETITKQGDLSTSPKPDTSNVEEQGNTVAQGMPIDEVASSTKATELYGPTESIAKTTKGTDTESITEQEEVFTDVSKLESLTTEAPVAGPVIIEPQEGTEIDIPENPVTSKVEEEITTKVYQEEKIESVPESQVTEEVQSITPEIDSTFALPEQSITTERISEIIDEDEKKPESPESHGVEPEEIATQIPTDVNKIEVKPEQPEHSFDKEEVTTQSPEYAVTEPERRFTLVEESSVTGHKDISPINPEESTEYQVSTGTEKTEGSLEISTTRPEKPDNESPYLPEPLDSDKPIIEEHEQSTQKPESTKPIAEEPEQSSQIPDSQKPIVEEQDQSTQIPEVDKPLTGEEDQSLHIPETDKPDVGKQEQSTEIPESEKLDGGKQEQSTEILESDKPVAGEQEQSTQLPAADKPIAGEQEQSTQIPDSEKGKPVGFESPSTEIPSDKVTTQLELSSVPVKEVPGSEEKFTNIPDLIDESHTDTMSPEVYTEEQEIGTEKAQYHVTISAEHSKVPEFTEVYMTEIQETSTKSGQSEVTGIHIETNALEVTATESHDIDLKEQVVTGTHKSSTELPSSLDEQTELPVHQVTSDVPQSLITEHPEDLEVSVTVAKEDATQRPEVTQSSEITKAPELHISEQEEIQTETPIHTTDSIESDTKLSEPETPKQEDKVTEVTVEAVTEKQDSTTLRETPTEEKITRKPDIQIPEITTAKQVEEATKSTEQTPAVEFSETTPYLIELEEHTHKIVEYITTVSPSEDEEHSFKPIEEITTTSPSEEEHTHQIVEHISTVLPSDEQRATELPNATEEPQVSELTTKKRTDEEIKTATKIAEVTTLPTNVSPEDVSEKVSEALIPVQDTTATVVQEYTTSIPSKISEQSTPNASVDSEKSPVSEADIAVPTEKETYGTEKPLLPTISHETSAPEDELIFPTTKATTPKQEEEILPTVSDDKLGKPSETSDVSPSSTAEVPKPGFSDMLPTEEIPAPEEDGQLPPSEPSGYGEPDYMEEDQAFGPGTCRYGGKVYVSAQQIPRDDPCDFCFCFRSDIICLQQSCPPPIHGCHEEPIQGFCCPRYECPVSMATSVNVTTTTTTTTTTLPPHFPTHSYKGAAQRRGCHIKGHTYKVGEVVRSSSGPCLHCTCGGDGQMKCDPKACTPEPMLRQMIAAAVSAKRRR